MKMISFHVASGYSEGLRIIIYLKRLVLNCFNGWIIKILVHNKDDRINVLCNKELFTFPVKI